MPLCTVPLYLSASFCNQVNVMYCQMNSLKQPLYRNVKLPRTQSLPDLAGNEGVCELSTTVRIEVALG